MADRELHYCAAGYALGSGDFQGRDWWFSLGPKTNTTNPLSPGLPGRYCQMVAVSNTKFSDYVGLTVRSGYPWQLVHQLHNDSDQVLNVNLFNRNTYGPGKGSDLANYSWKVQSKGIRFAKTVRVYKSTEGALTRKQWTKKYKDSNFSDGYFPITKIYRCGNRRGNTTNHDSSYLWDSNETDDTYSSFAPHINAAGGDCFINYVYKRVSYGLGIRSAPTALDPELYTNYNRTVISLRAQS